MPPAPDAGTSSSSSRRHVLDVVVHLTRRQLESEHRLTVLGWLWPLARQLVQLAVLVFIFGSVLDLGIEDFPLFVFSGLLLWSWFSSALSAATGSLVSERHLLLNPRLPAVVLPLVAVLVPLVDLVIALPVLAIMLAVEGELHATIVLVPLVLALELALIVGLSLVTSALNVYFRDVGNVVGVGLLLMFYVTPIFYGLKTVPEEFQPVLEANPVARLIEVARGLLLEGRLPSVADVGILLGVTVAALALGAWTFRRLQPDFIDHL
jgi:lipopolysaccharide transport system permease protein